MMIRSRGWLALVSLGRRAVHRVLATFDACGVECKLDGRRFPDDSGCAHHGPNGLCVGGVGK